MKKFIIKSFCLVGNVLREKKYTIIFGAYAIVGAWGMAYLCYLPRRVKNMKLFSTNHIEFNNYCI